ncbi:enoyl-(Acyl carrier protein) reductase domain-containing protein [Trichoderma breve]|uniref:Enoyl-(Acyl carrier protein) reductase domain-containing protein n=1 Tax=Trichoderma breve TaxID=2034170 RepID=A0A9W9JS96_9HYPO|nr:enoyl-(Acyl carrier protein) reductase domain-containing protein [Trichoderma breve]KAJ4865408.1 enoyl-(Acyl carrier protein) reductase domain-containing protein [Trichoderma breve]
MLRENGKVITMEETQQALSTADRTRKLLDLYEFGVATSIAEVVPGESGTSVTGLPKEASVGTKRFSDFDLAGNAFVVTGGARGLGLALAEALVEAGGKVYCLDRLPEPDQEWQRAQQRVVPEWGGTLEYKQLDVNNTAELNRLMEEIASENGGIQGVIAAAGIQQLTPAIDYTAEDVNKMIQTNYTAAFMTAQAAARMMLKYKSRGSICLVASMSGSVANKGLFSSAYNSSKAALIQLARNLAMEWSSVKANGEGGIRVNCLSPGHIVTPMVLKNFEEVPGLRETWSQENMMGRLAETSEFKGAGLFLMSNASTFMTGSNLVIDGGHTAW